MHNLNDNEQLAILIVEPWYVAFIIYLELMDGMQIWHAVIVPLKLEIFHVALRCSDS